MEAHMNVSFGSVLLSELGSVDAVLLEKNATVWHSTHPCKRIAGYTVVRSIGFLPLLLLYFYFNIEDILKKHSDGNQYELNIKVWLGITTYINLKSDLSSHLIEVVKFSNYVINPTEGVLYVKLTFPNSVPAKAKIFVVNNTHLLRSPFLRHHNSSWTLSWEAKIL